MGAAAHGGDIGPDGAVEGASSGVSVTDGVGVGAGVGVALGVGSASRTRKGGRRRGRGCWGRVRTSGTAPTTPSAPSTAARRETSCLPTSPSLLTAPAGDHPGGSYPARVSMPSSQVTRDDATPTGPAGPVQGLLARWFDRILWVNAMLQVHHHRQRWAGPTHRERLGLPDLATVRAGELRPGPAPGAGHPQVHRIREPHAHGRPGGGSSARRDRRLAGRARRHLKRDSLLVLGGIVLQALLGGLTVLAGLHPVTVATHFLVSAGLVAIATRLHLTRHEPDVAARSLVPSLVRQLGTVTCLVAAIVLTLGTVGDRLRTALRGCRHPGALRLGPAHHLLAARRRGDALRRSGRGHVGCSAPHRVRRQPRSRRLGCGAPRHRGPKGWSATRSTSLTCRGCSCSGTCCWSAPRRHPDASDGRASHAPRLTAAQKGGSVSRWRGAGSGRSQPRGRARSHG